MNYRQAKIKGRNMFHYYDFPTNKKGYKKMKQRKTRIEIKKKLQKERKKYLD
nr:MAG TPA: hypothetical protein [Herelleviridae sp.]